MIAKAVVSSSPWPKRDGSDPTPPNPPQPSPSLETLSPARPKLRYSTRAPSMNERVRRHQACDQDRDDVYHLDHGVDRRAGSVLEGVAHRVTGDGGLVRLGALAAQVALFDELLGIVPGCPAAGHEQGQEEAGDDGADEHAPEGLRTQHQADRDRSDDRD